jgi:hypothetical protein
VQAEAFRSRMETYGWSVEDIAARTGKTPNVVRSRLALLQLDPMVQHALATGQFWVAGGADIAALDHARQRLAVNCYAANKAMTGAEWKALVRRLTKEQAEDNTLGMFDADNFLVVQDYVEASKADQRPNQRAMAELLHRAWWASRRGGADVSDEIARVCALFDIDVNTKPRAKRRSA